MRINRNDSERGGGTNAWSPAAASSASSGHGPAVAGGAGSDEVQPASSTGWFEPILDSEGEINDCPGGICPVPWATKEEPPVLVDNVNHPEHYNTGGVECIEAIEAQLTPEEYRGYLRGNCAKYLWRCNNKGHTKQDLEKCQWYLNRLLMTFDD